MKTINICAVQSWVLAKLAIKITQLHGTQNNVSLSYYNVFPNNINFYMDISNTFRKEYLGLPNTNVGFYTHNIGSIEKLNNTNSFMQLDGIVTMDKHHKDMLVDAGYKGKITIVVPGNYQRVFKLSPVKLLIAHRGTRGQHYGYEFMEKFVDTYKQIHSLEFVFIGDGWEDINKKLKDRGVESEHYSDKNDDNNQWYPKIYQTGYTWCDFNLVTIEETAGPMCLPEALACGKPTIMPPVGFGINEFPAEHYYKWGDVDSLGDILDGEIEARTERRNQVTKIYNQTLDWNTFARDIINFIVEVDEAKGNG